MKFLARLDAMASTIVPILYLGGLAAGTVAYFTGVTLDAGLAVGFSLAIAAEVHSWLQQRRMRAIWQQYNRARLRGEHERAETLFSQVRTAAAILAALVLFSTYNAIAFVAATWRPIPGFLPGWLQIGIRAAVIPAFFLLSGALSPLDVDASALLASASQVMLYRTVRTTVRQWQKRIARARKRGIDLAPVAIALMVDAGEHDGARRIQLIADGLAAAESGQELPRIAPASLTSPASDPAMEPPSNPPQLALAHPKLPPVQLVTASTPPRAIRARRSDSGHTRADLAALWERDTDMARAILAQSPSISKRELARRLSVGRHAPCHPQRASTIWHTLHSEGRGTV